MFTDEPISTLQIESIKKPYKRRDAREKRENASGERSSSSSGIILHTYREQAESIHASCIDCVNSCSVVLVEDVLRELDRKSVV